MASVAITGTSAGIGLATTLELARAGHTVYALMRNSGRATALADTATREGLAIHIRELDVDSDESVRDCFAGITGPLDVLVNNAGIERHGSVEELALAEIIAVMNTNYFGAIRCIKAVLPAMRAARKGCIVNVSSVAGRISSSPLGSYAASKFALEAISEALAGEVKPYNIRVAIVEPGIQDTKMARNIEAGVSSEYRQPRRFFGIFREALKHPVPPSVTAGVIRGIVDGDSWQLRYPSGPDAIPFLGWRAAMSDEQWVDWNAQEDEAWYQAVERDFGMNAR